MVRHDFLYNKDLGLGWGDGGASVSYRLLGKWQRVNKKTNRKRNYFGDVANLVLARMRV